MSNPIKKFIADLFVTSGGTSAQYVKGDGTLGAISGLTGTTSGGGNISGTGTTNTIPKWNSTTGLTDSQIFDNGINVGISNTNPVGKLDIITNITNFTSQIRLTNIVTGSTGASSLLSFITDNNNPDNFSIGKHSASYSEPNIVAFHNNANSPIYFATNSIERMRITNGGNVLIGTKTDNLVDKLQVNGSLIANSIKKSGGTSGQYLMADGSVSTNSSYIQNQSVSAQTAKFWIDGGTGTAVNVTGDGDGTDLATFNLGPNTSTFNKAAVYASISSNLNTNFAIQGKVTGTKGNAARFNSDTTTEDLVRIIQGNPNPCAPAIRLGHVGGIGLQIENSTATDNIYVFHGTGATGNPFIYKDNGVTKSYINYLGGAYFAGLIKSDLALQIINNSSNPFIDLITTPGNSSIIYDKTSSQFRIYNTGVLGLAITNSGNVLIGTATDNLTDKLQVNGSIFSTAFKKSGGTANQYLMADGSISTGNSTNISGITAGGELSGTYPNPSLTNTAVINKVLTGFNAIGTGVTATDTILQAFGKLQNQTNGLIGGVRYLGLWNASTNTPTLSNGSGSQGDLYIVSVSGTTSLDGISTWSVGDRVYRNATAWTKPPASTDLVTSVNGYIGTVTLASSDIAENSATNRWYTPIRESAKVSTGTTITATSPLTGGGDLSTNRTIGIQVANTSQNGYLSSVDWQLFNNKIGGTLTTNVVPKATASKTLGDSQITDNGTGVGIGGLTQVGRLDINTGSVSLASVAAQLAGSLSIGNIASAAQIPSIVGKSGGNTGLYLVGATIESNTNPDFILDIRENDNSDFTGLTSAGFRFSRFGNPLMDISRNGNVGIGMINPNTRVNIESAGASILVDALTISNSFISANTETGIFFAPTSATGGIRGARISAINDGSNNISLKFYTGAGGAITEKMRITNVGGVLINQTTDNGIDKLQVNGTIEADSGTTANQVVIKSQLDLKANIASPTFTGIPAAPTAGAGTNTTQIATTAFVTGAISAGGSGTANTIVKWTGTTGQGNSQITDNGTNVAIGVASPVGKLDINTGSVQLFNLPSQLAGSLTIGNVSASAQIPSIVAKSGGNTGLYLLGATIEGNTQPDMIFDVRENDNTDFTGLTSSGFRFSRFGNMLVEILRNGNVGIGTAAPSNKLHVNGGISANGNLVIVGTTGLIDTQYSNDGGNFYVGTDNSTGSNFGTAYASILWKSDNRPMVFAVNNAESMRINGGRLIIGTATDNTIDRLQVNGTISALAATTASQVVIKSQLDLKANSAITISTTAPLTGGGDLSANRTIAMPAATTSVNGYLTSTDWTTFNNKITFASVVSGFATGANSTVLNTDTLESALEKLQGQVNARTSGVAGTTNFVSKFTAAGTIGNSQIFDNGTNVAINTSSPESGWKFVVDGIAALGATQGNSRLYVSGGAGFTNLQARDVSLPTQMKYVASSHTFDTNVAIGNTDFFAKLDVRGDVVFGTQGIGTVAAPVNRKLMVYNYLDTESGYLNFQDRSSDTNSTKFTIGVKNNSNVLYEAFVIDGINNTVGIGVSAPTTQLHLKDGTGLLVQGSNARVKLSDTVTGMALRMDNSGNMQVVNNVDSPLTTFRNGGNVLIGTTTDDTSNKLQVNGGGTFAGVSTNDQTGFSFKGGTNALDAMVYGSGVNKWVTIWTNQVERLRVDVNGNIGMGTTTPRGKLHVNGDLIVESGGTGVIRGNNNDYGSGGAIKISSSNTASSQYLQLGRALSGPGTFSPMVHLDISNSNFGVGTTAPGVRFVNSGGAYASAPSYGSGTVGSQALLSPDGKFGLYQGITSTGNVWHQVQRNDGNNAVYDMIFQPSSSGGNVIIGTLSSNLTDKLQVNGSAAIFSLAGVSGASRPVHVTSSGQLVTTPYKMVEGTYGSTMTELYNDTGIVVTYTHPSAGTWRLTFASVFQTNSAKVVVYMSTGVYTGTQYIGMISILSQTVVEITVRTTAGTLSDITSPGSFCVKIYN